MDKYDKETIYLLKLQIKNKGLSTTKVLDIV